MKEKYSNIETVNSQKEDDSIDHSHDKYKSDLSIITDGVCS
jgi:hypothetical protein